MKEKFIDELNFRIETKKLIYLDGATGSNLQKAGMPAGVCPEEWILSHPDIMLQLQQNYVNAGSDIIYAPTFTSNRIKLAEYGLQDQIVQINTDLVKLSKSAAGKNAYVAGDITMTGQQLAPIGTLDFEDLISIYKEQIKILADAGVDLLIVETMMSLQETRAALIAAKETCDLPVMCTLSFEADVRTLYGTDAVTAAVTLEKLGACAVGANCSSGPVQMCPIIKAMRQAVSIPIIAKPNAGMPSLDAAGNTVYSMQPKEFAASMLPIIQEGAFILGGCCGTDPSYILALKKLADSVTLPVIHNTDKLHYLTSERKTVSFHLDNHFLVVGERINPTGKKKLQEELRQNIMDSVIRFTEQQEECGADILDINVGMSGIDENEMMQQVLCVVTEHTSLPLSIDTSRVDVMEQALRRYPGRALVNSISLEADKINHMLPLVKKYGAMFILLPLSDHGLPKNISEKEEIIQKILDKAYALGLSKEDIIVDGLVTTVGVNPAAAQDVFETISFCRRQSLATTCGLSNVSFGLPERIHINTAFLTMAIQKGLTMAILNPSQESLMNAVYAADMLAAKPNTQIRYIEKMNQKDKTSSVNSKPTSKEEAVTGVQLLYQDVLKGNKSQIVNHTKIALQENCSPECILKDYLMPAINEVGELFNKAVYFLPQLINSAETMKLSIELLEPLLASEQNQEKMPVIVIATVKGDIHDIGKNLVALMLRNYGFEVIDLGKDVSKEDIWDAAVKHHASIIALSALMTTTMKEMKHVVDYVKAKDPNMLIMIGGAVTTSEYAEEIGADGYSKDAAESVHTAQILLKQKNTKEN